MSLETWTAVDRYYENLFLSQDQLLEKVLQTCQNNGLPDHQVSPLQGQFLHQLIRLLQAKRVLEIGTLGGYSAIWMARALPAGGCMITLETNAKHADVAQQNIVFANVASQVTVRLGNAADTLQEMVTTQEKSFDFIFIDADKPNNPIYLEKSLQLSHPGTCIVADNIVRDGNVINEDSSDEKVQGIRLANKMIAADPRLHATTIQTVGQKGYDGFSIIMVAD